METTTVSNDLIDLEKDKKKLTQAEKDKLTVDFVSLKKKEMKDSQYRKRFDNLSEEIANNIVNTTVSYGEKLYERTGWGSVLTYTKTATGNTDVNVYPQKLNGRDQNRSGVPVSQEPIAFSKIITAASVLGGKIPDATVESDNKIYSKAQYELWKRTWANRKANGSNTLVNVYQNLFTYGWAAWRVYPRRVQVERSGVDKIIFDDIYREAMDPNRTWLGVGFNNYDGFSQFEIYYEKDLPKELFFEMYPAARAYADKLNYGFGVTQESKNENNDNQKTSVTIGYYENVLMNRFIVNCGDMVIYDGELPNEDSFGSIIVARCFVRNANDPHGVGLYEMMRGNTAIYTYINSLNAQQVEAEIFPLIFGAVVQNGTATYKRGPNVVNPKNPGTTLDVVNTKGNIQGGIAYANQQKQDIEDNTGINNIVAGQSSENTLGSTVILAEAALKRLTIPRNSIVDGLELDALITCSWIKQTYSVDKAFLMKDDESVQEFIKQNPDYFVSSEAITNDEGELKGYAIAASPNLRLNFDFDEDGKLIEDVPTRKVSAKALFDEMKTHGVQSPYINFIIDPSSMLLPSQEIEKQQYMTMFPVITQQIAQIFGIRMSDPQAAASQLKALECLLKTYKEDIYSYMSKNTYDEIISEQPSQAMMAAMQNKGPEKPPSESLNYKDAPEDIRRQIEEQAGLQPSQTGGAPTAPVGSKTTVTSKPKPPVNTGTPARPQSPLGSAVDASLGYAAAMPFTPNK